MGYLRLRCNGYPKKDDRFTTGPRMDTIYDWSFETVICKPYRCSHNLENESFHKSTSKLTLSSKSIYKHNA